MARTLEQILKAKGYSDADLTGMAPLLSDAKFRGALEDEFGAIETDRDKQAKAVKDWDEWHQTVALPKLQEEMDARQTAEADAGANRARLETLQKQGLIKLEEQRNPPKEEKPVDQFDYKKYGLVTRDDVAQLANLEGEAIMLAQDIAAEHAALGLGPLKFRELRKAAMEAKMPVDRYWEQTYKVPEKRQELATRHAQEAEAKIRADERSKVTSEYANPQTRPGVTSRASFLPQPKPGEAKMPWDDANARTAARVDKAVHKIMEKVN
jgi:hypothetical protein